MHRAHIGLGSNQGDRLANLESAIALLRQQVQVTGLSPIYETEPVGFAEQSWFLNAVAEVDTALAPQALFAVLQEIESCLGKATPFPNGPRTIDLDLLLYDSELLAEPALTVPHPRLHERRFVLMPLADVAPDAVHPLSKHSIASLLASLPEGPEVRAWTGPSIVFGRHAADAPQRS